MRRQISTLILAALERTPDVYLFVTDFEGNVIYCNRAADDFFGAVANIADTMEEASTAKVQRLPTTIRESSHAFVQFDQYDTAGNIVSCRYSIVHLERSMVWIGWLEQVGELEQMVHDVIEQMGNDHRALSRERRKNRQEIAALRRHVARERRAAETDSLTGVANRRALDEYLAKLSETDIPFCVFVTDLDGFKQLNDRYGHTAGDKCLQQFTVQLQRVTREEDLVARLGGDEFVIAAPLLDNHACLSMVRRIKRAVTACECHDVPITVSVGTACIPGDGDNAQAILALADDRMYADKKSRPRRR